MKILFKKIAIHAKNISISPIRFVGDIHGSDKKVFHPDAVGEYLKIEKVYITSTQTATFIGIRSGVKRCQVSGLKS